MSNFRRTWVISRSLQPSLSFALTHHCESRTFFSDPRWGKYSHHYAFIHRYTPQCQWPLQTCLMSGLSSWASWMWRLMESCISKCWSVYDHVIKQVHSLLPLSMLLHYLVAFSRFVLLFLYLFFFCVASFIEYFSLFFPHYCWNLSDFHWLIFSFYLLLLLPVSRFFLVFFTDLCGVFFQQQRAINNLVHKCVWLTGVSR